MDPVDVGQEFETTMKVKTLERDGLILYVADDTQVFIAHEYSEILLNTVFAKVQNVLCRAFEARFSDIITPIFIVISSSC